MSRQVQCANRMCPSYDVTSKRTRIHRITHEQAPTFGEAFLDIFGLAIWGFLGFIVLSLIIVGLESLFQVGWVRNIIGILYLIATVVLAIIVLRYVIKNFRDWAQSDPATHYHCHRCEYQWNVPD